MLSIDKLSFSYHPKQKDLLHDVSFEMDGGVCGLLGANGVGKSTILYLIAGLLTPDSGTVTLDGRNTRERLPETMADIFIVPEQFEFPAMKLSAYIGMIRPFYPKFSIEDLKANLARFDLPYEIYLRSLSMGMAKKVLMSIALAANTRLLLMDEPTNGLDIPSKAAFRSFIASQMNPERIVIISTHQVQDINLLVDRVLILNHDSVVLNQPVTNIIDKLSFSVSNDPEEIGNALISLPSPEGTHIVEPNLAGFETTLDLEALFTLVVNKPQLIKELFAEEPDSTPID